MSANMLELKTVHFLQGKKVFLFFHHSLYMQYIFLKFHYFYHKEYLMYLKYFCN
jgi:hypothetical protein